MIATRADHPVSVLLPHIVHKPGTFCGWAFTMRTLFTHKTYEERNIDVPSNFEPYFLYVEYPVQVAKMLDFLSTTSLMHDNDGLAFRLKKVPKHDTNDPDWWKTHMKLLRPFHAFVFCNYSLITSKFGESTVFGACRSSIFGNFRKFDYPACGACQRH